MKLSSRAFFQTSRWNATQETDLHQLFFQLLLGKWFSLSYDLLLVLAEQANGLLNRMLFRSEVAALDFTLRR